jgi:hypothetical protein
MTIYPLPLPDLTKIKLRKFENPMRDDGVFVAEDKDIDPYPGISALDGSQIFPAVPRGLVFGHQMPHALADRVIACWNAFAGIPTEEIKK